MGNNFLDLNNGSPLFWVITVAAVCIVCAFIIWMICRKRRARRRLRAAAFAIQMAALPSDAQQDQLEKLLANTGYAYDWQQNIYYSTQNPWQRALGYCGLYDEWSAPLGLVFDSEPVQFAYGGKRWLIEFWKGQYGITTGSELGIYNTTEPDLEVPGVFKGPFYHCAADEEAMDLSFTLLKDGVPLFTRKERHWWLTGFVLGEYTDPSALTMDATLTFEDPGLQEAFLAAIRELGYDGDSLTVSDNVVRVVFDKPLAKQPATRRGVVNFLALQRQRLLVASYKRATQGLDNMVDILARLKERYPVLFRMATGIGRPEGSIGVYDKIRAYLG